MTGRWRGALVVAAGSMLLAGLQTSVPPPVHAADPVRILVIGDSVTQGSSGDWTWRYRLWRHLEATKSVAVDLVGPRTDVWDYLADEPGSQDYADPAFDQDHAARWGMTLVFADTPIDELVETYEPDVVVEMLGTNDLLYLQQTPSEVEDNIENFVTSARSADPGVDIVLSEVTQTWLEGAPELNDLLADGAAELDSVDSRVLLADTDAGFTREAHTFDSSHPNAQGEVLIAAAVADQLATLGIGTPPDRPLPSVPLGPRIPPVLSGAATDGGADLEWVRSPGSQESEVWQRDLTTKDGWQRVAEHVTGVEYSVTGLPDWHVVQFQTRPFKGTQIAQSDAWSNIVEVDVVGDVLAAVATPSVDSTGAGGAAVSWPAVPHASSYVVEWRRATGVGEWLGSIEVSGTSATVTGLAGRTTYAFRVRATHGPITGPDSPESTVRTAAWPGDPARVLLLGDADTIGSTGDWTWRYRLWRSLATSAPGRVDLVGPRNDLYDRATGTYGHQDYLDPAFDRDHAAVWGLGATFPVTPVEQLVANHDVDMVVEMLGLTDLVLLSLSPEGVAAELRDLVADARGANPDIDVVLGEVPQTWVPGVPELNDRLHGIAAELDTPQARVVVAETADGFDRRTDTYDDSHADARGELKIAAAVADALARTDLGAPAVRPLPDVAVGPRLPVALRGKVRDGKVVLKWSRSPGADDYKVLVRGPGQGTWKKVAVTSRRHVTVRALKQGERLRFAVLPRKGRHLAEPDVLSNVVRVRIPV